MRLHERFLMAGAFALAFLPGLTGCANRAEREQAAREEAATEAQEAAESGDIAGAMDALGRAMGGENADQPRAEPVDFRRLQELLPEEAGGLRRGDTSGERAGAMGFTVSHAEADYGEGDATAHVKITDMGNMPGIAMMGIGWAMGEVDRETSDGYERTTEFEGHRAFEQFSTGSNSGQLQVLVADRFLVEATGNGMEMDRIKGLVRSVNLRALNGMRDEGR
ncbi:MAG TPA: hypothetical protein VD962_13005 [Rubricoccaceae bacterium]|nr:hypothetical protein [Rubricoccaceae bacterium]